MTDRTANVLASVEQCSPEEKDAILSELLREKWTREGGKLLHLAFQTNEKRMIGVYCPAADSPPGSPIPSFTPEALTAIQRAVAVQDEEEFTTEEAKEYIRRAVARKFAQG